ncbi:MAG: permease [Bacteroidota bacterium]
MSLSLLTGAALYPWLPRISTWLAYRVLALERGTHLGSAVEFFVYEAPKVLFLLAFVVFSIGILRTYITPERTRALLAGRNETVGNVLAASLGIATPFCSCSAVPLFIGFLTAGIPLGVTFSFLIAAPMVNEVALALLFALFGWKVAGLYLATGLMVAIISGWVIGRLRLERHVEPWVYGTRLASQATPTAPPTRGERIHAGLDAVREIAGSVWPFVLAGIAVGAGIHGWVPENFMASFMGKGAWWSVPLAVLLGIPMYSNAAGIIPVVHSLLEKGAALGTVLAFMMAVVALSLPEVIILRRVLRPVLMGAFVGIVALGIILVGYLFNAFI